MSLLRIAAALSLAPTASEDDVLDAIAARDTSLTAMASALKVATNADAVAIATAVTALGAPDPAKFVPISDLVAVQTQVTSVRAELDTILTERRAADVDAAIAAGKLVPAQKAWALALAASDPKAFTDFIGTAPDLGLGKTALNGGDKPEPKTGQITADERAIASQLGLSEADYLKSKTSQEAA